MLFKLILLFKNGQWKFLFWQKNRGHFWTLFWSKIWPFSLKNQVFGHFLRIRTSDLSKTWSETGIIDLNHRMPVLCLRKFLVRPFCPFLAQKYIVCGDIIWFWAVFGHFLLNRWWFFVNFCYLTLHPPMVFTKAYTPRGGHFDPQSKIIFLWKNCCF